METPGHNLRDLLDKLRDLPAEEQSRRLAELPAAIREELEKCLKVAPTTTDLFKAVTGADPKHPMGAANQPAARRAPAAVSLESVIQQLADSGIISPGKLDDYVPPRAQPKDVEDLLRELCKNRLLTKFQAQQIAAGRGRALILGAYTLLDKIGAGGMGQVYKAHHRRMDRLVAIKMLPSTLRRNPAALARFEREVRAAAKLRHPNIVAADDAAEANGVYFLVMEYVDGTDLSVLVKKSGPIPLAQALNYILQAARGLEFAHGEGVVHRDIKPSNLLLDKKGVVKILDMGLARLDSHSADEQTQTELTGTGVIMGTVDFMSPEQALNSKNVDHRTDIYSLGISLYYLLAGKCAYDGDSVMEKLLAHREKPIPSLQDIAGNIPDQVQAVFNKMVAKNREDRYATMGETVAALEQCQSAVSLSNQSALASHPPVAAAVPSKMSATADSVQTLLDLKQPLPALSAAESLVPLTVEPRPRLRRPRGVVLAAGLLGIAIIAGIIAWQKQKETKPGGNRSMTAGIISDPRIPGNAPRISGPPSAPTRPVLAPGSLTASGSAKPLKTVDPLASPASSGESYALEMTGFEIQKGVRDMRPGVEIPTLTLPSTGSLTLEAWVTELGHSEGWVFSTGVPLILNRGDFWMASSGTSDLAGGVKLSHRPCHLALVRNESEMLFFVNGRLTDRFGFSNQAARLSHPLDIGTNSMQMRIAEIRISKVARYDKDFVPKPRFTPDADTLALYHCDEGTADVLKDSSGNQHDGKIVRAKWVKSPQPAVVPRLATSSGGFALESRYHSRVGSGWQDDNGRQIPVTEAAAEIPFVLPPAGPLTLEAWVTCLIHNEGWVFATNLPLVANSGLTWAALTGTRDQKPLTGGKVVFNQTVHLALVRTTNEISFFVDGQRIGSGPIPNDGRFSKTPLHIGTNSMQMRIAEIRISNSARYLANFNPQPRFTPDADTLALYHCDEGTADVLKDSSGNHHDGKIVRAKWVKASSTPTTETLAALPVIEPWQKAAFQAWIRDVQTRTPDKQIEAVVQKLRDLNPEFDGVVGDYDVKGRPKIEGGLVTELGFCSERMHDISPVMALKDLKKLSCWGGSRAQSMVSDLSPLRALRLTDLRCGNTGISDLRPLKSMPLTTLACSQTLVFDLDPLRYCSALVALNVSQTPVTPASVASLQTTLPNCKITWDDPARVKPTTTTSGVK